MPCNVRNAGNAEQCKHCVGNAGNAGTAPIAIPCRATIVGAPLVGARSDDHGYALRGIMGIARQCRHCGAMRGIVGNADMASNVSIAGHGHANAPPCHADAGSISRQGTAELVRWFDCAHHDMVFQG